MQPEDGVGEGALWLANAKHDIQPDRQGGFPSCKRSRWIRSTEHAESTERGFGFEREDRERG